MCYNAKRGENMKLAIDAMSGDLGSSIVVEACQSFLNKNKTDNIINTYTDLDIIDELKKIINNKDNKIINIISNNKMEEYIWKKK